jgi:hypothetical protein
VQNSRQACLLWHRCSLFAQVVPSFPSAGRNGQLRTGRYR